MADQYYDLRQRMAAQAAFGGSISITSSPNEHILEIANRLSKDGKRGVDVFEVTSEVNSNSPYSVSPSNVLGVLRDKGWKLDGASNAILPPNFRNKTPKVKVEWNSVILPEDKKEQIQAAISQVKHESTIFEKWGFGDIFEKGTAVSLIFWGVPGTGKTLTAQALADQLNMELKAYSTAEIESSEPGGAERAIKQIFAHAKEKEKEEIVLFDECDSLLADRNEVGVILGAQINALLTEIERFSGVIIFTTNRLGKLDAALERRITTKVEFEFPKEEHRHAIWKRMVPKKAPLENDVSFESLAKFPIAGGNIKNAVLNAARQAAYAGLKKIPQELFIKAAEKEIESITSFSDAHQKNPHTYQGNYINKSEGGLTVARGGYNGIPKGYFT